MSRTDQQIERLQEKQVGGRLGPVYIGTVATRASRMIDHPLARSGGSTTWTSHHGVIAEEHPDPSSLALRDISWRQDKG